MSYFHTEDGMYLIQYVPAINNTYFDADVLLPLVNNFEKKTDNFH